jgi:hypothetical protein
VGVVATPAAVSGCRGRACAFVAAGGMQHARPLLPLKCGRQARCWYRSTTPSAACALARRAHPLCGCASDAAFVVSGAHAMHATLTLCGRSLTCARSGGTTACQPSGLRRDTVPPGRGASAGRACERATAPRVSLSLAASGPRAFAQASAASAESRRRDGRAPDARVRAAAARASAGLS